MRCAGNKGPILMMVALLSLGNCVEELSEIVHRGRNDYLIIWAIR
jgi:hypothetical protein